LERVFGPGGGEYWACSHTVKNEYIEVYR
jgi:hypothetical protein